MPAVTYPQPRGASWDDLDALVRGIAGRPELAGFFGAGFFVAVSFAADLAAGFLARVFFAAGFFAAGFFAWLLLGVLLVSHQSLSLAVPAPEWARKVRVGANSPSLWPTIDSEM